MLRALSGKALLRASLVWLVLVAVSSVLGPRYLTHSFSFSKVQRCGLSAVGHADASRPQPNLGRELRVSEGEVLLASLLSNRLQNERLRVSGSSKWVHGVEPRVLGTLAARLEDLDLEGVHVSCQGPAERGVSRAASPCGGCSGGARLTSTLLTDCSGEQAQACSMVQAVTNQLCTQRGHQQTRRTGCQPPPYRPW